MAGTAQRKRKRIEKQAKKAARPIRFANSVGSDLPLPAPPDFGAPRFTPEQQAANPNEPMTRVIKDLGRVGVWKSGFGPDGQATSETFDEATLRQIHKNALHYMRRYDINLGKGHGDEDLAIHPDDLIAPCDNLIFENGVLWGSFYVTPSQAEYLKNPARKTSPGLVRDYQSGDMTKYPGLSAVHFAVTDRPVIGGQGRFLALTNWICPKPKSKRQNQLKRVFRGSNRLEAIRAKFRGSNIMPRAIALANSLQGGNMDFAALLAAINTILAAVGLGQLPDNTDETNLIGRLEGLAIALGGEPDGDEGATGADGAGGTGAGSAGGDVVDPNVDATGAGVTMRNRLFKQVSGLIDQRFTAFQKELKPVVDGVKTMLAGEVAKASEAKKAAYMTFRNALGKAGVAEAILAKKDAIAEKSDWNTDILEGLSPTITMQNATQAGASAKPAESEGAGGDKPLSDEAMKARLKARGINPDLMPTS